MEKFFLNIDRFGKLFYAVPEGTPGSVSYVNNKGVKSWRIYMPNNSVTGEIHSIFIKEVKFTISPTKYFYLVLDGLDGNRYYMSFPLFTMNGSLDQYVQSIAMHLPQLSFDKVYRITPSTKPNAKGYLNRTLFITEADTNTWMRMPEEEFKKLPPPDVTTRADGVKLYNWEARTNYLYKIITSTIEKHFPYTPPATSGDYTPPEEPRKATPNKKEPADDLPTGPMNLPKQDMDDLPF